MAHGSMKLFFAMLFDKHAHLGDAMLKISAKTKPAAIKAAEKYITEHPYYTLAFVYTRKKLQKTQPEWHRLTWGLDPDIEVR